MQPEHPLQRMPQCLLDEHRASYFTLHFGLRFRDCVMQAHARGGSGHPSSNVMPIQPALKRMVVRVIYREFAGIQAKLEHPISKIKGFLQDTAPRRCSVAKMAKSPAAAIYLGILPIQVLDRLGFLREFDLLRSVI